MRSSGALAGLAAPIQKVRSNFLPPPHHTMQNQQTNDDNNTTMQTNDDNDVQTITITTTTVVTITTATTTTTITTTNTTTITRRLEFDSWSPGSSGSQGSPQPRKAATRQRLQRQTWVWFDCMPVEFKFYSLTISNHCYCDFSNHQDPRNLQDPCNHYSPNVRQRRTHQQQSLLPTTITATFQFGSTDPA